MAWGRLEDTFHDEPKFFRLAQMLEISFAEAAGHMACLWSWAHRHAVDGDLRDYDVPDISRAAKWDGDPTLFVTVLAHDRVKLLDFHDGTYVLHNFAVRAEARKAAKKKAKQRQPKTQNKTVPGLSLGGENSVPREKRRERGEEMRERVVVTTLTDETRLVDSKKGKPMVPFVIAEFRRQAVEHARPLPENHDSLDEWSASSIYTKYPNHWKPIVERYMRDSYYERYGWSLQNLAKNVDLIANRSQPKEVSDADIGF